jgi:hypothetical protein
VKTKPDDKQAPRGRYVFSMRDAYAELRLSLPSVNDLIEQGKLETYMLGARRFTTAVQIQRCVKKLASVVAAPPSKSPNNRHNRKGKGI